jgi:hypothetical protein
MFSGQLARTNELVSPARLSEPMTGRIRNRRGQGAAPVVRPLRFVMTRVYTKVNWVQGGPPTHYGESRSPEIPENGQAALQEI